jgi:serine/threonine protein kinase
MAPAQREREVPFRGTERFAVERKLGTGGMGVVYRALDKERNVPVALKVLRFMDAASIARFKNEFRALADLVHRNLIRLGELYCEGSQWFFTMELIEGQDFLAYVAADESSSTDFEDPEISPSADTLRAFHPAQQRARRDVSEQSARCHELRLRGALAQLAQGVHALHAAGKVHRDIKPSNILVTSEGRVAVVDFGLVTDATAIRRDPEWTPQGTRVVGTAAYMAPEQGASQMVGPEADWYSVGVVLYEALTGRPPFLGRPLEVLTNKQRYEPTPPRAIAAEVPADLDQLCVDLLRWDPKLRPTAKDILSRLGVVGDVNLQSTSRPYEASSPPPFVGRQSELDSLRNAFDAVRHGQTVTCFVHGESGLGKSALVHEFMARVKDDPSRAMILFGRCYEREAVPYKAIDGVIDAVSRALRRMDKAEVLALLPLRSMFLAQVFPALRQVEAVAEAPPVTSELIDPIEQRSRVFHDLRELFTRLARRSPLVVCVDDLQWADADSLLLLRELMRPPSAPGLLLIATVRTVHEGGAPDAYASIAGDVRHVYLDRLPPGEAQELAQLLVERALHPKKQAEATEGPKSHAAEADLDSAALPPSAATIAEEAGGHPLFIDELVRHLLDEETPAPRTLDGAVRLPSVEEMLWKRIDRLEPLARYLLEVVAVAGGPLPQEVVAQAARAEFSDFAKRASQLRAASLVQTTGTRRSDPIETYHDRVRTAVLSRMETEPKRYWHERLAVTLEAVGRTDPEALAIHWHGAGEKGRAARYAGVAAAQAAQALAFDRAARLYRLALSATPERTPDARALRIRLGDALVNTGRGGEAAQVFLDAVEGAPPAEALELKRRAADQLLRAGHIDRGTPVVADVLASVGLALPHSPRAALLSLAWSRVKARIRGLSFQRRDERELRPSALTRIDVCWSVGVGLSFVDFVRGADFQSRQLLLALEEGEPYRVGRAFAGEAGFAASAGGRGHERTMRLIHAADALAEELDHPHLRSLTTIAAGLAAMMEGRWKTAQEMSARAESTLRATCTGVAWETSSARVFYVTSLAYMGKLSELSRCVPIYLREARERGDLYLATALCTGESVLAWLVQSDAEGARRSATQACESWSTQGLIVHCFFDLLAQVEIDLYEGQGASAWQRMCARWPALKRSLLLNIQMIAIVMWNLRARAALAAAAELGPGHPDHAKLLKSAAKDAKRLAGEKMPWSSYLATLLDAQIATCRGDLARAEPLLGAAAQGLESIDMGLYAAAARFTQGEVQAALARGGKGLREYPGAELRRAAIEWMEGEGAKDPLRLVRLCAPVGPLP